MFGHVRTLTPATCSAWVSSPSTSSRRDGNVTMDLWLTGVASCSIELNLRPFLNASKGPGWVLTGLEKRKHMHSVKGFSLRPNSKLIKILYLSFFSQKKLVQKLASSTGRISGQCFFPVDRKWINKICSLLFLE